MDNKNSKERKKKIFTIAIIIPIVAAVITSIAVAIYWGMFDEDAVIGGVFALFLTGCISIPIAFGMTKKVKLEDKNIASSETDELDDDSDDGGYYSGKDGKKKLRSDILGVVKDVAGDIMDELSD